MLESTPQNTERSRSLLAPPAGWNHTVKSIFWNQNELRAGYRLAFFVVLFSVLVRVLTEVRIALHLPRMMVNGEITPVSALIQEVLSLLAAFGAAGILARLEGRRLAVFGLPWTAAFKTHFWQGVAWGIAMIAAMMGLIRVLGGVSFGGLALSGQSIFIYAVAWAMAFLAVGFFEEFLFRGYAQQTLASGLGFWPAAAILSAFFGAGHLANGGEGAVGALSVFVIGMFFCLTLRRTGTLWFAVGLHAAFDWGETYLFSVPDSGLAASGHLLNTTIHGPAWITGGTVGPEGSAAAFIVMGLAALIFSWKYPAREDVAAPAVVSEPGVAV